MELDSEEKSKSCVRFSRKEREREEGREEERLGPDFHRDLAFFRHRGRCASTLTRVGRRLIIASLVEEEERKKKGKKKEESFRTTVCIPVTVDRASSPPYLYHRLIMDHYPTRFVRRLNEPGMPEYESADVFTDYSKASLSLSFYLSLSRARTRTRRRTDVRVTVLREGPLLLRILGRGILSRRCDETRTRAINHRWPRI